MIQVRTKIFETNSSSVHSLTICLEDDFDKWKRGLLAFDRDTDELVDINSRNEDNKLVANILNGIEEDDYYCKRYYTYEDFFEGDCGDDYMDYMETYSEHKTFGKEKIVAFGYYGHD